MKTSGNKLNEIPVPFEFGIRGGQPLPCDFDEKKAAKLKKLVALKEIDLIKRVCRHYIENFIPCPLINEHKYWIISCFPSTDNSPVRISIWFPEVFNIYFSGHYNNTTNGLSCMVFVHLDYFETTDLNRLEQDIKGLSFRPYHRFVTGIPGQLAAFMPLSSYFDFIKDEQVYESIRAHNYELTLKGKSPFKRGHNFLFVRYLLGLTEPGL